MDYFFPFYLMIMIMVENAAFVKSENVKARPAGPAGLTLPEQEGIINRTWFRFSARPK